MYAARQGNIEAAVALLDSGAKIDEVSADKSSALVLSTINGHFDLAKVLIERGANVNLTSVDGLGPLYGVVNTQWARKSLYPQPTPRYDKTTHLELMQMLLDRGADPNARLTKDLWYSEYNFSLASASQTGSTPFWKLADVGDIDGMKLLVSRGADPYLANRDGVTPVLIASGAGTHGNDDVNAPPGRLAALKYLIEELRSDVNAKDSGGGGRGGGGNNQQQQQAQLQQAAVQLATQANNGQTPTEAQIAEQVRFLQQQQQQQGGFGRGGGGGITALHNAAARGDNEMILYLVSKGAKVDAVANNGATIVDLANGPRQRVQPYPETVALLQLLGAKNNHKCVSC
jgi:ankyrin repeat protein